MKEQQKIKNHLPPFTLCWFDEVESTNTCLLEQVRRDPDLASGTVWAARRQSAGRGRFDRKWISFPDRNLLFSLFYRTSVEISQWPSLSMAMAVAIDEMLHDFNIISNLKWPNDIQVRGCKIGGILAERAGDDGLVVGVGLNVNMTALELAQIDQPATSMQNETGVEWEVEEVLRVLLEKYLPLWLTRWESGGFAGIRQRWCEGCGGLDTPLVVREGIRRIHGTLAGFGENGELQLRLPDGEIQTIWAGDIVTS